MTRKSLIRRWVQVGLAGAVACMVARGAAAAPPETDWPTYGFDNLRTAFNSAETRLSPGTVPQLVLAWTFVPGPFDRRLNTVNTASGGTFGGQPVLAADVLVNGTPVDLLLVGDNNGTFFALDARSEAAAGTVVWNRSLSRLTEITKSRTNLFGVRSAAAIDRRANGGYGAVYIGTNGTVHAMDLATGTELPGWPVTLPGPNISTDEGFVHSGVNVVNGQLYVALTSNLDAVPYYGRLVRIDTASATVTGVWYTLSGSSSQPHASGGGIWSPGGVSVDPSAPAGGVYVATGNASSTPNQRLYAEYVVNLSPDLTKIAGYASPALTVPDVDYASTPVVFQPAGCPAKLLAAKNKSGLMVIETIGTDGQLSVLQSLPVAFTGDLYGNVAWDPADQLLLLTTPADGPAPFVHGLSALQQAPNCGAFSLAWQTVANKQGASFPLGTMTSPTVANGVAYFATATSAPQVFAVATASSGGVTAGQVLWQSAPNNNCRLVSALDAPMVANGWLYMSCIGTTASLQAFTVPEP